MKKLLCLLLGAILILSQLAMPVFATNEKVFYRNDFNSLADVSFKSMSKPASYEVVAGDEARGSILHGYTDGTDVELSLAPQFSFDMVSSGVAVFSYDVKMTTTDQYQYINMWDGKATNMQQMAVTGPGTGGWGFNQWQSPYAHTLTPQNKWARVDFVIDLDKRTILAYTDGEAMHTVSENNSTGIEGINYIFINNTLKGGSNSEIWLDNVTFASKDALDSENTRVRVGSNKIFVDFAGTISKLSDNVTTAQIIEVGSANVINATVTQPTMSTLQLDFTGALKSGAEYQVVFPQDTLLMNLFADDLTQNIFFNAPTAEKTVDVWTEDFSKTDTFDWTNVTQSDETWPTGFKYLGNTWTGDVVGVADPDDAENNVLMFNDSVSTDGDKTKTVEFDLPNMPKEYTLNLSYKVKTNLESVTGSAGNGFVQYIDSDTTNFPSSYADAGAGPVFGLWKGKGICYKTGAGWWGADPNYDVLTDTAYESGIWYQVDATYEVDVTNRPLVVYTIKKGGSKASDPMSVIHTSEKVNSPNSNVKTIQAIMFQLYDSATTSKVYLDDLNISYTTPVNAVKKARGITVDGIKVIPSVSPENSMIGMSLTFAEDPTTENITATLSGNGSEVSITPEALGENEYKFMWNQFLPSSEYTFKVMYGSDEYIYTFTPVPSADISIKEFGLFNSSSVEIKNANDLIAGENYTASVKIYNPTGDESKTAYLIYAIYSDNGETLEAVNFADSALSGSVDGNPLTKTFTMPEGLNNPIVKVFLWKNIEFAVPYADNLVIGRN